MLGTLQVWDRQAGTGMTLGTKGLMGFFQYFGFDF